MVCGVTAAFTWCASWSTLEAKAASPLYVARRVLAPAEDASAHDPPATPVLVPLRVTVQVEPPESWSRTVTVPVGVTSPASSATLTVTVYA